MGLGPGDIVSDRDRNPTPLTERGTASIPTFRPSALARSPISAAVDRAVVLNNRRPPTSRTKEALF